MVGDTLRQAREKQGLTIADVAGETSIREAYLEAIEKGNYDALPGDVYAKGFIRNYSRFLQVDGDALLQEYDSERNIVKALEPVDVPQAKEPPKQKANLFTSGDDYRHRMEREEKSGSRKFMILLAVMVVFLGGVYIAFMDDGSENTASKAPVVKSEQQQKQQEPEKKVEGIEIKARLLADCWISVKVDGTSVFEGTAEKGREFTWKGKNTVEIVAGNAGGIEITENGKNIGRLGEAGQVTEKSFKAEIPGKDEPVAAPNSQQGIQEASPVVESSHEPGYTAPEYQTEAAAPAPAALEDVSKPEETSAPEIEPASKPAAEKAPSDSSAAAAAEG